MKRSGHTCLLLIKTAEFEGAFSSIPEELGKLLRYMLGRAKVDLREVMIIGGSSRGIIDVVTILSLFSSFLIVLQFSCALMVQFWLELLAGSA